MQVPQATIDEANGSLDIPANGRVTVTLDDDDAITDEGVRVYVESVEELERRRWYLVRTRSTA